MYSRVLMRHELLREFIHYEGNRFLSLAPVVEQAQQIALKIGHEAVTTDHVFYGALSNETVAALCSQYGITNSLVVASFTTPLGHTHATRPTQKLPLTPLARQRFWDAKDVANDMHAYNIHATHVMIALLKNSGGQIEGTLEALKVPTHRLLHELRSVAQPMSTQRLF